MTYFTLSSPFVHYLLPDSSVCFILKIGGAENFVHACRRRYAPSRTDQKSQKDWGFLYTALIYIRVLYIFPISLFFCGVCRPKETKTPWKKHSASLDYFQMTNKHMDKGSIPVYGFCRYFKENLPHNWFCFLH